MTKSVRALLLCMLVLACLIVPTSGVNLAGSTSQVAGRGQTLYVGGAGPGNFSTIQAAVDNASAGDIVFVYDDASPYRENVTVSTSITLQGERTETTLVDGSSGHGISCHILADNVTFTGFTVRNTGTAVSIAGWDGTASHAIVTDNIILNATAGVVMDYRGPKNLISSPFGYNVIAHNFIKNTTLYAIMVYEGRNNLITGNTIMQTHGSAMFGYGYGIGVSGAFNNVSYNNVSGNDRFGIALERTYQTSVYRNTLEKNSMYGLVIESGSHDQIVQNNFIGNHRQAALNQQIKILHEDFAGQYPLRPSVWKGNFWDRPRLAPYIIPGFLGYLGVFPLWYWGKHGVLPMNYARLDRCPAWGPYVIPSI